MKHQLFYLLLLIITAHSFDFRQVQSTAQTSKTINTLTNNTFLLDRRTTNSIAATPYITQPVAANATVVLIFPSVFTLSASSVTCLSITVDSVAVNSFTCSVSGNSVTFGNVFTSISNLSVGVVSLTIGNILNPSPAISIANFSGYIGVDYAVPSGISKIQLTPGSLQNCSITFTPGFANLASSSLIATMTPADPHPVGSTMTIQFPRSTWTNDVSNQALPIQSSMTCSRYQGSINSGITCVGSSGSNLITLSNIFSSTLTNSQFAIAISNFLSPPSNQPSDLIVITTFQGTSKIDTCNVYPSGISPLVFTSFSVTSLTTMKINQYVSLQFDIYPSMMINQSDTLSIAFPNEITYTYTQIVGTGYYISPPTFSGQTVLITHDTSLSASSFDKGQLYRLTFESIKAPPSTSPTSTLTFQFMRNNYPIMYGTTTLTAVSDTLSASVTRANSIVWANTTYTFTIVTSNPLSQTGIIKITFPSSVTPPSFQNCASILGTNMNTVPQCSYDSGSNSISLSNLNASSSITTIPSQTMTVSINGVVNPSDTSTSGSFTITTYYTSNVQGVVDSGTIAGITSTIGTISINTVSVVPSSYVCMQSGVTYSINFNNTYTIPINGYIIVRIPLDITIITASLPNYCRLSINGGSYASTTCASTAATNSSYYQITFSAPAQTSSISANSLISLQVLSLCTNPTNTRIITPFSIFTYSSNGGIQSRTTGITVQMQTPASFIITQVTRSSEQNSALNSYTITLKQQAALPSGAILMITFPTEIFLTATSTCTDLATANLNCTLGSYHSIQVPLNEVIANSQFGVIISNIRNPPSYKSTTTIFAFETKTSDLVSSYSSGSYSTPFTNSVPSAFRQISYSFSPGQYGSSQTLTLSLTPSIYTTPSTYLVSMANSFTVQTLSCGSQIGFNAPCAPVGLSAINISGTLGSSQVSFSISGFTSPVYTPADFSYITSYDSAGFLVDQDTATVKYSILCQIPCKSCSANISVCLSCYNNSNITANNLYYSVNNSCLASCPDGYYSTSSLLCIACSSICLTCTGSSSNCASCNSTSSYPALNITNGVGTCLSSCPTYFYLTTVIFPNQCTSCVSPCLTCSSLATCLSCVPGRYFYNLTCQTTCPSNTTIANNNSWTCDSCSSQCGTCLGTVSTCTSCSATSANYNGACLTQCPSPLVISNGTCASCDTVCLSCSLVSYNCTSCSSTSLKPFLSKTNTSLGSCLSICPFTYYGDTSQGICTSCSTLNINCTNCSSTTTCYNCDFGSVLVFYNNQCLSYTPVGFYNDSGTAKPCNSNCSSCASATNCTSCTSLSLSYFQCVSTCPSNQVSVNRVCVACNFPCLTCSVTQNNCTSCNSTISNPYYLSIGSCLQICPNFTYANSNGWVCSSCVSPCQKCNSLSSCSSCMNGYNLYNQTCLVTCPLGFVGLNKICTACTNNCSSCSGSTSNCLSCLSGNYLVNSSSPSCSPTCPTGLYPNNSTQSCTGCTSPCSFCSGDAQNCTACLTGLLQNNQCVSNCSLGYYLSGNSCPPCNSNCTQCTSPLICQSCIGGLVLSGTSCVQSCPSTTPVVNNASQCSACSDPYCVNCSSLNICYACFYPKLFFNGACLSNCPANYAADGNYSNCVYSPSSTNSSTQSALSSSLISTSIFPVPFTIGAAFLVIACLMSKFQHSRTDTVASLYALWGLLQWASIAFLVYYYWQISGNILKLQYLLVAGGLAWIYLINSIFLLVQSFSLKKHRRFKLWVEGSVNTCWYYTIVFLSFITIGKLKFILFCKLFNFRSLSAKLDDVGGLRVLHAYAFASILASVATMSGAIYLLIESNFVVNQLLMAQIDVLVLSILQLVVGIKNVNKDNDFFQDIDEDGLIINKRIEIKDQEHPSGVMPEYNESDRDSFNYRYKGLDSAKKLQQSFLSEVSNHKSFRDISIQAQSILGQRSLISRLGTQTISQLSLFDRHDISIQMDPVRDVQDVSIAASERRGKMHDVSAGQSVIFMDASVNPSLIMKDVSIQADKISHKDVSIDQTQKQHEQVSVQMNASGHQISVQLDGLSKHQISIQYVPIYTDQTVQMTKEEEELGIQCNADHQNISIQYSAKPLIEQVDDLLPSQTSLDVDQPSDLDLQRKLVMHPPAPQEVGMKAQLQLDIHQKLQRKKRELQKLQQERRQRERNQAIQNFQNQIQKKQIPIQVVPFEPKQSNVKQQTFNNDFSSKSHSLVNSNQQLTLNLGQISNKKQIALDVDQQQRQVQIDFHNFKKKQPLNHSPQLEPSNSTKRQVVKYSSGSQEIEIINYEDTRQKEIRQINNFFNSHNDPSSFIHNNQQTNNNQEVSRVKTEQQFLQMLSGNHTNHPLPKKPFEKVKFEITNNNMDFPQQPAQQNVGKVKFEIANNVIENDEEIIQDQDLVDEPYEPIEHTVQIQAGSAQKSRSTAILTTNKKTFNRQRSNVLESSRNSIQKSYEQLQDQINNRPLDPKMKEFRFDSNKIFKKQQVEQGGKTNLTQFLEKKRKTLITQGNIRKKLIEEEDVLTKELQYERQRPLPAPKADLYGTQQSFASYNQPMGIQSRQLRRQFEQPQDLLALQVKKSLNNLNPRPNQLPKSQSRKQIVQSDVGIEKLNKQKSKGYLRETYGSQQKKKSLEKIYLNKGKK